MIPRVLKRTPLYLVLAALAFLFAAPMLWLISSSLKPEAEVLAFPPTLVPSRVEWSNYPYALAQFPWLRALANTMIIFVAVWMGTTLTASMAAYAFARLRFPLKSEWFLLVLSTMMIPYHVTLLPTYLIFRDLHWLDSLKPLTIPAFFGGGAFWIFLLRQFFMTIPRDYDDAARIDGCGTFSIYWRIILPLSMPALGVVTISIFMGNWNDFFGPLIYLNSRENFTLALAYMAWRNAPQHQGYRHLWSHIMAIGTVLTIPPLAVFFVAQRYFIQGIVVTGLKG